MSDRLHHQSDAFCGQPGKSLVLRSYETLLPLAIHLAYKRTRIALSICVSPISAMHFRSALLASFIATSVAQSDQLTSIAQALNASGLTGFAGLLPTLNSSTTGQALFRELLGGGNFSLFIPNNEACE
jgi:hypothetical protein